MLDSGELVEDDGDTLVNDQYTFNSFLCPERNVSLFEIVKPHTDLPYTIVVRDFNNRGLLPVFTSLVICHSWGVCSEDLGFLKELWRFLEMEEEFGMFDIEALMKDATERCVPTEGRLPEPEPEVYRRTIDQVLQIFMDKEMGR